jgi:hypothetical protein
MVTQGNVAVLVAVDFHLHRFLSSTSPTEPVSSERKKERLFLVTPFLNRCALAFVLVFSHFQLHSHRGSLAPFPIKYEVLLPHLLDVLVLARVGVVTHTPPHRTDASKHCRCFD